MGSGPEYRCLGGWTRNPPRRFDHGQNVPNQQASGAWRVRRSGLIPGNFVESPEEEQEFG